MLAVSVVYRGWQAGDWMDAYLGRAGSAAYHAGYQVIMIIRLSVYSYRVISYGRTGFIESILRPDSKLWIDEGIEGITA